MLERMDLEECIQITDSTLNYLGSYCHLVKALVSRQTTVNLHDFMITCHRSNCIRLNYANAEIRLTFRDFIYNRQLRISNILYLNLIK